MKGLILKDIYNLKGMAKSLLFLIVIFALAFKEQGIHQKDDDKKEPHPPYSAEGV